MSRARIPVHLVAGPPGSGKSALIARLCAERTDWLGLVNAADRCSSPNLRTFTAGCPCCTGKIVLQVGLARALRETGAVRAFVELSDASHSASVEKMLGELPLGTSVFPTRTIWLPSDVRLGAGDLQAEVTN